MLTAKFRCEEVTRSADGTRVRMVPVASGSPENDKFFEYTPYGALEMGSIDSAVAAEFEPRQEFYLRFEKAPRTEM